MIRVDYITNKFFTSRTYVLSNEGCDGVWLVDCGDITNVLNRYAKGKKVIGVLMTHTHADHIYGLNRLLELFPDVEVYTNAFGKEALSSPKLNVSKYHDEVSDFKIKHPQNVCVVDEDAQIELFEGCSAEVFSTIGHDASCLTYKVENYLFTGDSYIPGIPVVAKFPKSNKKFAAESEKRIKAMAEDLTVCPGHSL